MPSGCRRFKVRCSSVFIATLLGTAMLAVPALAQSVSLDLGQGGTLSNRVVQLVLLITVLSVAPGILLAVTSFTRIAVVLSLLRNALGTQQAPPNGVLISLAMFLSFFIMAPTFQTAWENGIKPFTEEQITQEVAYERTAAPFRTFMLKNTRTSDLQLFVDISKRTIASPAQTPMSVLVPAFMISELRRAFEIGFLLFLPFVIIDLVVSAILMSMGMMMLPPVTISLPFKLIFFVLVDGWALVAGSLVRSFTG
ncbi:flagellar type III secretion system pore protein FliP [Hankyongella ginsenosidimutans]|uniref:Flagellar biosynthetic protein FliP n=2 Tax=Hankyongella ginsenosidimutans TaxID=1763828 RepID=A0A4D7BY48_9SPHN|nr:flagellar type III secretion system pore protein FliP [Hankyongella ginsenosidimutans]